MKPKLLDLFCGAGGAGMGYFQAGFNVIGVDIKPQRHYPFKFIQEDAMTFLGAHLHEFDIIHASPPCQRYSVSTPAAYKENHPDLLPSVADFLRNSEKLYVIENVPGARHMLKNPIMLCGTMFGLRVWRHRFFETNAIDGYMLSPCNHVEPVLITGTTRRKGRKRADPPISLRREVMKIDWMSVREMDQAIPPAYTRWIGEQILGGLSDH